MSFRMRFVVVPTGRMPNGSPKWVNASGVEHCVMLVQQTAGARNTAAWRPGLAICDAMPGEIPPCTAIATFVTPDGGRADTPGRRAEYFAHPHVFCSFANAGLPFADYRYSSVETPYRDRLDPKSMVEMAPSAPVGR